MILLHYFCLLFTLLVSPITSAIYKSYQCLNGKGCTFVKNISRLEEAEFRNIVFDGSSYFAYSQNDCYGSNPYWVPGLWVPMTEVCEKNEFQIVQFFLRLQIWP